jgi:hypothetical protein
MGADPDRAVLGASLAFTGRGHRWAGTRHSRPVAHPDTWKYGLWAGSRWARRRLASGCVRVMVATVPTTGCWLAVRAAVVVGLGRRGRPRGGLRTAGQREDLGT